ncbi:EDD domain protein, DegV family [Amphibacillus marinus]|uniref:EDD domain protein, DegV family n=1 Tax=Amphibacillus marinus TaxID=872970 RepID=A0A1H8Q8M9_9BACI|nr:DegV family protein [Amphibacillus marinus]SEO50113.1 EDD domain protein, DegV family [Amphibacillus marinus]
MNVKIIADSACDLNQEDYLNYDIDNVSLTVLLDDETYLDGKTISAKTVYDAMRAGKAPKTSQVTPQDFKDTFIKYAEIGQPCLYLAFSSELSGTYQSAVIAAKEVQESYPDWSLETIDTKCASFGYGLVVIKAAELAKEGRTLEEVTAACQYQANHMEHIFTVDDLEYLYRGGRVSKSAAFVGTLLKIKPLLHMNAGKLIPLEKIRGSKKVFQRMLAIMSERGTDFSNQTIGISHGDSLERAEELAELIKVRYDVKEIKIRMVGSSIGAHSGPGTIALFFSNDKYE